MNRFKAYSSVLLMFLGLLFATTVNALPTSQAAPENQLDTTCGVEDGIVFFFIEPEEFSDPDTLDKPEIQYIRSDDREGKPNRGKEFTQLDGVSIPAGTYEVFLQSFDHHTDKAIEHREQPREQWQLIFLAGGDEVAISNPIDDLPDTQDFLMMQVNSALVVPQDVDAIQAFHAFYLKDDAEKINSVYPVCVGLKPVEPEPEVALASLGDVVWLDENQDGRQDEREQGVANVVVNLVNADGERLQTTVTDENGRYAFTELEPGAYAVNVVPPDGMVITTPDHGDDEADSDIDTNGRMPLTTLDPGEVDLTWDAGLFPLQRTMQVAALVYCDVDGNGRQDAGEDGLPDMELLLSADGVEVERQRTDSDGRATFAKQNEGTHDVQFVPAENHTISGALARSSANSAGSEAVWTFGLIGPCSPQVQEEPAAIGDVVWLDGNQNHMQDENEAGVSGVLVRLLDENDAEVARTATDENGRYRFESLVPGAYSLHFVPPAGYTVVEPDAGDDDGIDSDMDVENGRTVLTTLAAGEMDLTWDAGLSQIEESCDCPPVNGILIWIIGLLLIGLAVLGFLFWRRERPFKEEMPRPSYEPDNTY